MAICRFAEWWQWPRAACARSSAIYSVGRAELSYCDSWWWSILSQLSARISQRPKEPKHLWKVIAERKNPAGGSVGDVRETNKAMPISIRNPWLEKKAASLIIRYRKCIEVLTTFSYFFTLALGIHIADCATTGTVFESKFSSSHLILSLCRTTSLLLPGRLNQERFIYTSTFITMITLEMAEKSRFVTSMTKWRPTSRKWKDGWQGFNLNVPAEDFPMDEKTHLRRNSALWVAAHGAVSFRLRIVRWLLFIGLCVVMPLPLLEHGY